MKRVVVVFGTRPEAIKMAPVILQLRQRVDIETVVCVTGQHRGMLDAALATFDIRPDYDLAIMRPGQTLANITIDVLANLSPLLAELKPDRVLVHGDTTTTYAASVACFYLGVPVGHVEAGLRTGNLNAPWPEEFNRRVVDLVSDLLWAPTEAAAHNLRREGINPSDILVTGNTAVDAVALVKDRIDTNEALKSALWRSLPNLSPDKRLVLFTGHRRESFGEGMAEVCHALNRISERSDVEVVWPVHPNPKVLSAVDEYLTKRSNIYLIKPLDYLHFTALMMRSCLIITDSGGIQEEAPSLQKPVIVTRNETERPEAVTAGFAKLVGPSSDRIVSAAGELLDDDDAYSRMTKGLNPFGDGKAAEKIVDSIIDRQF